MCEERKTKRERTRVEGRAEHRARLRDQRPSETRKRTIVFLGLYDPK